MSANSWEGMGDACWSGHPAYLSNRDHPDNIKARRCGVGHSGQEGRHYWADCAMGRGNTSGTWVQVAQVLWSGSGVQRRGMDCVHPSRRIRMQGLCGKVRNPASPSCWDNWDKPEESHQGADGGGREGKLLVVATEEGQELALGTPVRVAAGGGGEMSPQATAPHREMYWIGGETSVNGGTSWWPCSWPKGALEEVRQAEMSSRKHHLYIECILFISYILIYIS